MATPDVLSSIEPSDYRYIAEAILEEMRAREKRREHLEKHWKEIDRQLRMEPEKSHKMIVGGSGALVPDKRKAWMPEIELPLQTGALETLLSDVRRLRYPTNGDWFNCRTALTPEYLERFQKAGAPFIGEQNAPAELTGDNADKMTQGFVSQYHNYYDMRGHMDLVDVQALAYGVGVGRMRRVEHRQLGYNSRTNKPKKLRTPILIPRNIKNVFLDDSTHALMHEGFALGPATIQRRQQKLVDLRAAAAADKKYLQSEVDRLQPDKNKNVTMIELEGDFPFDRGAETVILQDVCLLVAYDGKAPQLVKIEEGEKFSTYLVNQYHLEGPEFAYAAAPLLKGMPVAKAAAQALNRIIESGQLRSQPPVSYSPDDANFSANGGPVVHPGALWETIDGVNVHSEIGGDPQVLLAVFTALVQMYADVVGVTPARLGAETKSHTTAYSKEVEVNRGAIRTVDYVQSTLHNTMTRMLDLEYRMGLDEMKASDSEIVFIEDWDAFIELKKAHLPDIVKFRAVGSDAPAEEQQRSIERLQAAQSALQIDMVGQQSGKDPVIQSVKPMIEQMLREGGWENLDELFEAMGATPTNITQLPGLAFAAPAGTQ